MYKVKSLVLNEAIKMPPYSKTSQFYMEDHDTQRRFDVEYDDIGSKIYITPKKVAGSNQVPQGVYVLPFIRASYIQLYDEDLKKIRREELDDDPELTEQPKTPIIVRPKIRTGSQKKE